MPVDHLTLDPALTGQQRAHMPRAIAPLHQVPIQPQYIGDRHQHQQRCGALETPHRECEIALPIEAEGRVDRSDPDPGRPIADQLGHRSVQRLAPRGRLRPVDPGTGMAMHPVNPQRPGDHRHPAAHQSDKRRIGSIHAESARHQQPGAQPRKTRDPAAGADRRDRPRIGLGLPAEKAIVIHADS